LLNFPGSVSIPGTRSLSSARSSRPLVLPGLARTPGTHPPPSPALAPLAGATGTPPHTAPAPLWSPMPRAPPNALRLCTR
ncbi:hypothetical protein C0993_006390, partial [Termitomyces sp. T159_Od127]